MELFLRNRPLLWPIIFAAALLQGSCSRSSRAPESAAPLSVEVFRVEQKDIPIYREWIGTLAGMVNAEIKAQVSGYLLRRAYEEGSHIRKDQLLFLIDPRTFQSTLNQAAADLKKAEAGLSQANARLLQSQAQLRQAAANQGKTQLDVDRYTPLAKEGAVTRQDLDNAVQFNLAAKAQVEAGKADVEASEAALVAARAAVDAAKAEVQTAEINLGYTKILAPIDGIAGRAQAQVGDLVGPGSGVLTTISKVDPIRAYFTVSEQEYLEFAQINPGKPGRRAKSRQMPLELILADGSVYPHGGKFYFTNREVDSKTGSILLAGIFPNPEAILRPGLFARIRGTQRTRKGALLVPQRAVTELQGAYQVAVVGPDDRIGIRTVKVGERVGALWIVNEGLQPGERVVAEGVQKVHQGMVVNPKPFVP
jgi:RND family efflux transporter MFP subunit